MRQKVQTAADILILPVLVNFDRVWVVLKTNENGQYPSEIVIFDIDSLRKLH